jgi:hypothetical protein
LLRIEHGRMTRGYLPFDDHELTLADGRSLAYAM